MIADRNDSWSINLSQMMLVLDVDGVTRHSVEDVADGDVIKAVRDLLDEGLHRVVFLSGSPANVDPRWRAQGWCRPNKPLADVFAGCFDQSEIASGRVGIVGQAGAETLTVGEDTSMYSSTFCMKLTRWQRHAIAVQLLFNYVDLLQQLSPSSSATHSESNRDVLDLASAELEVLEKITEFPINNDDDAAHHAMFEPVVTRIRQFAPSLTLVSLPAMVETTVDLTDEQARCVDILAVQDGVRRRVAAIPDPAVKAFVTNCFAGLAHREGSPMVFAFCVMTDKGTAVHRLIRSNREQQKQCRTGQERKGMDGTDNNETSGENREGGGKPNTNCGVHQNPSSSCPPIATATSEEEGGTHHAVSSIFPPPRVITVGDTALDFKMHAISNWGFHVGKGIVMKEQRRLCEMGREEEGDLAVADGYQHVTCIPKVRTDVVSSSPSSLSSDTNAEGGACSEFSNEDESRTPSHCEGTVRLLRTILRFSRCHGEEGRVSLLRKEISQ